MKKLDKIDISKLLIRGIIGINDEERIKEQDIVVNVSLFANLEKACRSDSIEDTIDYKALKKQIIKTVKNSKCFLVERLAQLIAEVCLSYHQVKKVRVNVQKPGALRFAKTVGFTICRSVDNEKKSHA